MRRIIQYDLPQVNDRYRPEEGHVQRVLSDRDAPGAPSVPERRDTESARVPSVSEKTTSFPDTPGILDHQEPVTPLVPGVAEKQNTVPDSMEWEAGIRGPANLDIPGVENRTRSPRIVVPDVETREVVSPGVPGVHPAAETPGRTVPNLWSPEHQIPDTQPELVRNKPTTAPVVPGVPSASSQPPTTEYQLPTRDTVAPLVPKLYPERHAVPEDPAALIPRVSNTPEVPGLDVPVRSPVSKTAYGESQEREGPQDAPLLPRTREYPTLFAPDVATTSQNRDALFAPEVRPADTGSSLLPSSPEQRPTVPFVDSRSLNRRQGQDTYRPLWWN